MTGKNDNKEKQEKTEVETDKEQTGKVAQKEEPVRISPRTGKPVQTKYSSVNHKAKARTKKKYPNKAHNGKNSPVIGMNGYNLKEGDNQKNIDLSLRLFNLPAIDMDNEEEVAERLSEFFKIYAEYDMKPAVAGMALALNGMSRETLTAIAHDRPTGSDGYMSALPREVTFVIKKAYKLMETMWENNFQSGKLNPVAGIFLAKNNYGYKDQNEYVLTPNKQDTSDYSTEDIKSRYLPNKADDES